MDEGGVVVRYVLLHPCEERDVIAGQLAVEGLFLKSKCNFSRCEFPSPSGEQRDTHRLLRENGRGELAK